MLMHKVESPNQSKTHCSTVSCSRSCFFFNETATTEIYTSVHTLSLHDALPISRHDIEVIRSRYRLARDHYRTLRSEEHTSELQLRTLNSYAVFCLKKTKVSAHPLSRADRLHRPIARDAGPQP